MRYMASKLYGVNATIIIFVFVLYYCIWTNRNKNSRQLKIGRVYKQK